MLGLKPIPEELNKKEKILVNSLKYIDGLLGKHKYLCGDEITIADLSAFWEIIEIPILRHSVSSGSVVDYTNYKNINRWMQLLLSINEISESAEFVAEFVEDFLKGQKSIREHKTIGQETTRFKDEIGLEHHELKARCSPINSWILPSLSRL
jgi:glutathionyl-hydroquinone reductase